MLADDIADIVERIAKINPEVSSIRANVKERGKRAWVHIEINRKNPTKTSGEYVVVVAPYVVVMFLGGLAFLGMLDIPGCWRKQHINGTQNSITITNRCSAGVLNSAEITETMRLIKD